MSRKAYLMFIDARIFGTVYVQTGTGTTEAIVNVQSGKLTSVGTAGQSINFATSYGTAYDASGDFSAFVWGASGTNNAENVEVVIASYAPTGITVVPAWGNTTVWWITVERTQ